MKLNDYLTRIDKKLTMNKLDRLMFKMATPENYLEYVLLAERVRNG